MWCSRLDHFIRFNSNGTVSRCGHMVNPPEFNTLVDMESSSWLANVKEMFKNGQWPAECQRCQRSEVEGIPSIREHALNQQDDFHGYLQVGGILDNLCNSACQSCNENLSTRIGSLKGRTFPVIDNSHRYWELPQDRIRHLDINGGEPSYSKNYRRILENLPPNLKTLRLNTNCSTVLKDLVYIVGCGIDVTVTVSCDGIGLVHEYMRWPITWDTFYRNLMIYKDLPVKLNLWSTISKINQHDLPNIQQFAKDHGIDHGYSYLVDPWELNVDNTDQESYNRYIQKQDQLRNINIQDYIK